MKLVDLNILIYSVNRQAPQHESISAWWESALSDEESLGIPWLVIVGFLRVVTNPRGFPSPRTIATAFNHVDDWLERPHVFVPVESNDHARLLRKLLSTAGAAGNLVSDAHLAALAISYDAVLYSCDNDFARFSKLRWKNPLLSK